MARRSSAEPPGGPGILERLGGVLIDPEATFRAMLDGEIGVGGALITVVLIAVVEGLAVGSILTGQLGRIGEFFAPWLSLGFQLEWFAWLAVPAAVVGLTLFSLIFWTLTSWIAHVAGRYLFGGDGSYVQILTLTGYCWVAAMPFLAGIALTALTGETILVTVLTIVSLAWFFTVWVTAAKVVYEIDMGRAFVASFLTPLTIYTIILFLALRVSMVM